MMKLGTVIPYLQKIQKNILITWHTPWVLLSSAFFHWKSPTFFITRNTDIDCNLIHNSNCFIFFESLKVFFKHDYNLTMSTKLAILDFLKIKIFWSKGFDVIAFFHDVTNNILTRDWNCIVDVVMWPIFFWWVLLRFKFNNLGLAPGMALKFYTSAGKWLTCTKSQKFWG